jgi:hypothetical protein
MELARLMQAEFDKEEKSNQKEEDGEVPCEICYVNLYDDEMETLDRCGHLFHKGCMVEAFKSNILNNNFPILCPMEGCQVEATDRDLKCILSDSLFEKYQSHTLKSYADQHGGSVYCLLTQFLVPHCQLQLHVLPRRGRQRAVRVPGVQEGVLPQLPGRLAQEHDLQGVPDQQHHE